MSGSTFEPNYFRVRVNIENTSGFTVDPVIGAVMDSSNLFYQPQPYQRIFNADGSMYTDDNGLTWFQVAQTLTYTPWAEPEPEEEAAEALFESPQKRVGLLLQKGADGELELIIEMGKRDMIARGKEMGMIVNDLRALVKAFDEYLFGSDDTEEAK